ncbi:MAG: type IV toxin-antitoxin system AbiEi family antitoxin [Planctomycetes bacterium]|nr:type IV toxin-antitoxin system AbiEi family antitoxin [Planctomycetota bacterium]
MASPTLENWVDAQQARGKYAFLRKEALAESGLSPEATKKALQRLAARGRIAQAKEYFFVVVPLEYATAGGPPASWFIHPLMAAMGRPYYVGLLTAAGLHGASHHQPQESQVITDRPIRPITVGRSHIRFFKSRFVEEVATTNVKTPTGSMRVSTPEATAVDLVRFAKVAGQLDNVATVIAELAGKIDPKRLVAAAKVVGDVPNAQRLGYIFDRVHARRLAGTLKSWVDDQSPKPVQLRSNRRGKEGQEDRRWHVLVDQPLDIEA